MQGTDIGAVCMLSPSVVPADWLDLKRDPSRSCGMGGASVNSRDMRAGLAAVPIEGEHPPEIYRCSMANE